MKTLELKTAELINEELIHIPEEYQKNFNSVHEGLAVIEEEFEELRQEVFFGRKKAIAALKDQEGDTSLLAAKLWRANMRNECVQIAAMCARFIQELT